MEYIVPLLPLFIYMLNFNSKTVTYFILLFNFVIVLAEAYE